jgi:hypothetical protein
MRIGMTVIGLLLLMTLALTIGCAEQKVGPNQLTQQEIKDGWNLLFDGKSVDQWKSTQRDGFPEDGWKIMDGTLSTVSKEERKNEANADIYTLREYGSFELTLEFKTNTPDANSGVKYFVYPNSSLGLEYQVYITTKEIEGPHATADLYDITPCEGRQLKPMGEWNNIRIVANGKNCEHWLNGIKVLEFERGSEKFREAISKSKFKDREYFGERETGHIMLQDHPGSVSFRNIKIREL